MNSLNVTTLLGPRTSHPRHKPVYSKEDRSYVYKVEGSRKSSINLTNLSTSRGISYHYLGLQVRVRSTNEFTITITIRDDCASHFNFAFSTVARKGQGESRPSSSQTCALIGLEIPKDTWVTVYFDLEQISAQYWLNGTYHFLDSIEVSPHCVVRWIFAQEELLNNQVDNTIELPHGLGLEYPTGIEYTTVLIPQREMPTARKSKIPTRSSSTSVNSDESTSSFTSANGIAKLKTHIQKAPKKIENPPGISVSAIPLRKGDNAQNKKAKPSSGNALIRGKQLKKETPNSGVKSNPSTANNQKKNANISPSKRPKKYSSNESVKFDDNIRKSNSLDTKSNSAFELADDEEETDSDGSAFGGSVPRYQTEFIDAEMHKKLPDDEEDELELVYIEPLGCYYCPSNQQYYQLDDK